MTDVVADVIVEDAAWGDEAALAAEIDRTIAAAVRRAPAPIMEGSEIAVVLTSDDAVRSLNREHRGLDRPTNVLSFPIGDGDADIFGPLLGDIVLARETVWREAAERGWPIGHYLSHLVVHGFLHLIGYDHLIDDDAERMESLEAAILADLGISDPHAERPGDELRDR